MISYHKRGGLHFLRIGRLGFQFYIARKQKRSRAVHLPYDVMVNLNHDIALAVRSIVR